MKEIKKQTKGITLIALVITIIVLLILAGVSIAMLTGQNGILTQAQKSREQTDIGREKEQIALAYNGVKTKKEGGDVTSGELDAELKANGADATASGTNPITVTFNDSKRSYTIDANGNITEIGEQEPGEEVAEPQPTPEPEPGGSLATTDNGVIEIKWLKDDTYNVSETANAPVIKSDLPANTTMKLVKYDGSNWVEGTDYEYKAGSGTADNTSSKWANAEVTIDNVKSYFVWIPRYAYRIIYFDTPENKEAYLTSGNTEGIIGYSDSRGIVDKDGKKVDGVASTTSINVGDYFRVHPAFMNDSANNYENGGWSTDLSGIWVGKYESSLVKKADSSNINTSSITVGDIIVDSSNNTDRAIAVQPDMSSWTCCAIENMYTSAKAYATNLNSHMLKNSEWGAVAYLTESKYGRNGEEVTINDNSSYITADAGISANPEQSSTGNETGIYDLSGGAGELVAAYYTRGNSSLNRFGSSLVNETDKKYVTAYTGTTASSAYKPGDAIYETNRWHRDFDSFVFSSNPFFMRGGNYSSDYLAGVFYFNSNIGAASGFNSFRMCLAVK